MIASSRPSRGWSRRRTFALAASLPALGATVVRAQDGTPEAEVPADFRVVLHAAEADNWENVQSNVRNLQEEWPDAQLRVVVDGSAVSAIAGPSDLTHFLEAAVTHGMELQVCPNALKEHGIDPAQMPTGATADLGGVIAIVSAVHAGYVYIKP